MNRALRNHCKKQLSPKELAALGPTLEVEITIAAAHLKFHSDRLKYRTLALIDTGADGCCIDPCVASVLNLISLGKFPAGGTGGGYMADKYLVNFHFVGSDIGVGNLSVMEANLEKRPFKMLIGRDILSNAIFVYNGINGILEIRIVPPGMQSPKKPVNHPVKPPMPSSQNRAARRQAEKKKGKKKR